MSGGYVQDQFGSSEGFKWEDKMFEAGFHIIMLNKNMRLEYRIDQRIKALLTLSFIVNFVRNESHLPGLRLASNCVDRVTILHYKMDVWLSICTILFIF